MKKKYTSIIALFILICVFIAYIYLNKNNEGFQQVNDTNVEVSSPGMNMIQEPSEEQEEEEQGEEGEQGGRGLPGMNY